MDRGAAMLREDLPTPAKKTPHTLRDLAYEVEQRRALSKLSQDFERWNAGGIGSVDLADWIHEFHDGPNRKPCLVRRGWPGKANLIYRCKESIPKEVLPYLQKASSFWRPLV